jgi:hypothetical protein
MTYILGAAFLLVAQTVRAGEVSEKSSTDTFKFNDDYEMKVYSVVEDDSPDYYLYFELSISKQNIENWPDDGSKGFYMAIGLVPWDNYPE